MHGYIGEGMEEGKLCEARKDLGALEKDYETLAGDGDLEADGEVDHYGEEDLNEM